MRTNDIRRVIDATLDGLRLQPEQRREIIERATGEESSTPPRVKNATGTAIDGGNCAAGADAPRAQEPLCEPGRGSHA